MAEWVSKHIQVDIKQDVFGVNYLVRTGHPNCRRTKMSAARAYHDSSTASGSEYVVP